VGAGLVRNVCNYGGRILLVVLSGVIAMQIPNIGDLIAVMYASKTAMTLCMPFYYRCKSCAAYLYIYICSKVCLNLVFTDSNTIWVLVQNDRSFSTNLSFF
jgi:hypothetical protein